MGEHAQPVLGMKSCHEYSDEDRGETNWYALEWFVARNAEVQVSRWTAVQEESLEVLSISYCWTPKIIPIPRDVTSPPRTDPRDIPVPGQAQV